MFENLTESMINVLIPTLGPRRKFQVYYQNLVKAQQFEQNSRNCGSSSTLSTVGSNNDSENEIDVGKYLV